jgi:hypothetical protein
MVIAIDCNFLISDRARLLIVIKNCKLCVQSKNPVFVSHTTQVVKILKCELKEQDRRL